MLPPDTLPETVSVPVTLAPTVVATIRFVPPTVMFTFESTVGIVTLDVPFDTPPAAVDHERTPEPLVVRTWPEVPPVMVTLPTGPRLVAPVTAKLPPVDRLPPKYPFPVVFSAPTMLAPAVVATIRLVPATLRLMFEFTVGIVTDDVPLAMPLEPTVVHERTPLPSVVRTWPEVPPVMVMLPTAPRLEVPPTVRAPVMSAVPTMLAPVVVATIRLVPATTMLTFEFTVGIDTFDVPFDTPPAAVDHERTPLPLVVRTWPLVPPVMVMLPTSFRFDLPVTLRLAPMATLSVTLSPVL